MRFTGNERPHPEGPQLITEAMVAGRSPTPMGLDQRSGASAPRTQLMVGPVAFETGGSGLELL